jgi:hypothetical protein
MTPAPASFSDVWWQAGRTDAQLVEVMRDGGKAHGLSPLMPAYPNKSAAELTSLVTVIRSLAQANVWWVRVSTAGQPNRVFVHTVDAPLRVPQGASVLVRAGAWQCATKADVDGSTCTMSNVSTPTNTTNKAAPTAAPIGSP